MFRDLVVEHYEEDTFDEDEEGNIVLGESKDDICGVSDTIVSSATRAELLANPICSLNGKDYSKKEIVVGEGYELVKLGDICDINMGSTPSTKNHSYWENGDIPWVAISDLHNEVVYDTKKCLTRLGADTMKNRVISKGSVLLSFKLSIGKLGIAGREMYCNEAITYLKSKIQKISQMYLYYILEGLNIEKYGRGTIGKNGNLNKEILKNLQIPIPKSPAKIQAWVDKISDPYHAKMEKQDQIKELETIVQERIRTMTDFDEVELGSVCDIKYGKRITQKKNKGSMYDAYGGGDIMTYKVDEYNREGVTYKIARDGLSCNNCVTKIYGKLFLNDTAFTLHTNNNRITDMFIGEVLLSKREFIYKSCTHGSAQLHIDLDRLLKIGICIPKNKQFIQSLETTFQQIEQLQQEVTQADALYQQYIRELSAEAIP